VKEWREPAVNSKNARMAGDEKAAILGGTAHQSPAPISPIGNVNEEVAVGTGKSG